MQRLRRMLAALVMLCTALPLTVGACILFFRLTGRLSEGQMYFDLMTPSYPALIASLLFELTILAACIVIRKKLQLS